MQFKDLAKKVLRYNKDSDLRLIEKAYVFAEKAHTDEQRLSGEPFIEHPLGTAIILAELKVDDNTICAALLHDVLQHNKTTKKELEKEFGQGISGLVEGLTELVKLRQGFAIRECDAANLRKFLLAAAKDVRIILIKLADRLHNMRTVEYLPEEKQKKVANDILDIYAPLAYRLGIRPIKNELEDLAFKTLNPKEYNRIVDFVSSERKNSEIIIRKTERIVQELIDRNNISCEMQARVKHIYSIYKKIVDRAYKLEKMNDIMGMRIITENVEDCYKLIRLIHEEWVPIQGTFKDYIAAPKPNGYQSLHTAVIGVEGKPIEFQIRTKEMNEVAEAGVAAHFGYKGIKHDDKFDKKLGWLNEMLHDKNLSNKEFMENVKIDFFGEEIYVFTPKGKMIELPNGATALDFAYAIHSDVGNSAIGANINGKFVSLKHQIKNGEVIEISTSKNQKPSREWLRFANTYRAQNKIRQFFKHKGEIVSGGKVVQQSEREAIRSQFIEAFGIKNPDISMSQCCNPLPGDKIKGYRTGVKKITVHKADCRVIKKQKRGPSKEVKVDWLESFDSFVEVYVDGEDRLGFFAEILNSMASRGYEILDTKGKSLRDGTAECIFRLHLSNINELADIVDRLKKIRGVKRVYVATVKEKKKTRR